MKRIPSIVSLVLAVVLAAGVMTFASACGPKDDGSWMHCHSVQLHVFCAGLALALLSLLGLILSARIPGAILSALKIAVAALAIALPFAEKMCKMQTMRCYSVMRPFDTVLGVLLILVSTAGLILALRKTR